MSHHLTMVGGTMVSWRSAMAAALLAPQLAGTRPDAPAVGRSNAAHEGPSLLPVAAFGPVSQALGESAGAYRASLEGGGLRAANPAQSLRIGFEAGGVVLGA